jgi:hypothetical protein
LIAILIALLLLICAGAALLNYLLNDGRSPLGERRGNITWIRSIYGFGTAQEHLHNPTGLAVTPDGQSFYVADAASYRVLKYSWNGQIEEIIDKDAAGNSLEFPSSIAVGPDGWIYLSIQTYNEVRIFNERWEPQTTLQIIQPMAIEVNNDRLVVSGRAGFSAFTPQGELIGSIGSTERGTGDDQFDIVSNIIIDRENNVYVVDTYNNRLSKYNAEGARQWITQMGPAGNQAEVKNEAPAAELAEQFPAMLQTPMGLTMDGAGRLLVIDSHDFSITAWDANDGSFLNLKWGEYGEADGALAYANDITYNSTLDQFALSEPTLGRVQIIKLDGSASGLGGMLANLRGLLGPLLAACCWPLIIIAIILAIYFILRRITKKRQAAEEYALEGSSLPAESFEESSAGDDVIERE